MFSKLLILLGLLTGALYAQSVTPNQVSSGPLANRPQFCSLNDLYFATDQPADNNSFYCASQNNWVLVSAAVTGIDLTVHNLIVTGTFTGNATTATALQNVPTVCSGGNKPSGVDVHGNATGCSAATAAAGGSNGDIQINVSGSLGGLTAPAGFLVGTTATQTLTHKTFDATNVFPALPYDASGAAAAAVAAIPSATSSVRGLLTAADWVTFNGKDAGGAAAAAQTAAIAAAATHSDNASNLSNGTIPAARVPTLNQNTTGSAGSLSGSLSNCSVGYSSTGILANGNANGCVPPNCLSILTYGGSGNGSTSNNAAWTALLAAATATNPNNVCAFFPPGTYAWTTAPVWTAPNTSAAIAIYGAGPEVTNHVFASGQDGFTFSILSTNNNVIVDGNSFRTSGVGTTNGLAITNTGAAMIENATSRITNNAFYGADCKACTDYWSNAIVLISVLNWNISGNKFIGQPILAGQSGLGIGVSIFTVTPSVVPVIFNLTANTFDYLDRAAVIGDYVQGVTFLQNNFTGVNNCINVPGGEPHGIDQIVVGPGNQCNAHTNGLLVQSPVNHLIVDGAYFLVPTGGVGISLDQYYTTAITGGTSFLNIGGGGTAISFNTYNAGVSLISGIIIEGFTTGIFLQSASQFVTVGTNAYARNTTNVVNSGTNNIVATTFTGSPTASFSVTNGVITHQ